MIQTIDIGTGPNTGDGEQIGRGVWAKVNANFQILAGAINGIVLQENLGQAGFPPAINDQGAIEAIVSHRAGTAAELDAVVLADAELALERDGDYRAVRIGDGLASGGGRLVGRQLVTVPALDFTSTDFQTFATIPYRAPGRFLLSGLLRFENLTGDTVQWRFTTTNSERAAILTRKQAAPSITEMVLLGTIASGVVQHNNSFESYILPTVITHAVNGQAIIFELRKAAHTSGTARLLGGHLSIDWL